MTVTTVPTPESWVTPDIFGNFLDHFDHPMRRNKTSASSRILGELIALTVAPTHNLIRPRHSGALMVFSRIMSEDEVDSKTGPSSLIRIVDDRSARQVGLGRRHHETVLRFSPIAALAVGVWQPEDDSPITGEVEPPFVAQVGGYDFRAEQLYGTEGLLRALDINRRAMNKEYSSLQMLFDGTDSALKLGDELHSVAIPTNEVTLFTHRGLDSGQ